MWLQQQWGRWILSGMLGTGLLFGAGCAHAPPAELVAARQAFQRASKGPAATVVPAELHKARVALNQADSAFAAEPDAPRTRDLAYVAERRAERAEALAVAQQDADVRARAERELQNRTAAMAQRTKAELQDTRAQLAEAERARTAAQNESEQERQARLEAERRAADATQKATQAEQQAKDALAKLASVKEESRGMVITLSGSVLFASDQATLLPSATQRLDQVAAALLETKDRNLVIEGYTDSRGSEDHNLELSRQRAVAVRDYLIGRGYPQERVQAVGLGKSRPIADNSSAEGRANNRRVEIIMQPRSASYSQRDTR